RKPCGIGGQQISRRFDLAGRQIGKQRDHRHFGCGLVQDGLDLDGVRGFESEIGDQHDHGSDYAARTAAQHQSRMPSRGVRTSAYWLKNSRGVSREAWLQISSIVVSSAPLRGIGREMPMKRLVLIAALCAAMAPQPGWAAEKARAARVECYSQSAIEAEQ